MAVLIVAGPAGVGKSTVCRLLAPAFDRCVHLDTDLFSAMVVSGRIGEWRPEAADQNSVTGGAAVAAALQFALGGYTVLVDGHVFGPGVDGWAAGCSRRGVALHYSVLRAPLETCWARAAARAPVDGVDRDAFAVLHRRFADLGSVEGHAFDATGPADPVAAAVLAAFRSGRLAVS